MTYSAHGFTEWILADTSYRQDQNGIRPKRGQKIARNNKRLHVYSRKVLDPNAPLDTLGICWQPDSFIKGNDEIWRIALAVMALQQAGEINYKACAFVASVIDPMCSEKDIEALRARVNAYIKRCKGTGIYLEAYLMMMTGAYQYSRPLEVERL